MKKLSLLLFVVLFFSLNICAQSMPNISISDGYMISGGYYQIPVNLYSNDYLSAIESEFHTSDGLHFDLQNNAVTVNNWYWNYPQVSYDPTTPDNIVHWGLVSVDDYFYGTFSPVKTKVRTDYLQDNSTVYLNAVYATFTYGVPEHNQYTTYSPFTTTFTVFNNGVIGGNNSILDVVKILDINAGRISTNAREQAYYDVNGDLQLSSSDALLVLYRHFNRISAYPVETGYDYYEGYGICNTSGKVIAQQLNNNTIKLNFVDSLSNGDLKLKLPQGAWIEKSAEFNKALSSTGNSNGVTNMSFVGNSILTKCSLIIHGVKKIEDITVTGNLNSGVPIKVKVENATGIENKNLVPVEFSLKQNYPNPFNPSTTIGYTIPENGLVTLKIYNILGKEITTLVNEEKSSGVYEVKFNAAGLPSGKYIYKLTAGDKVIGIKKMILLK